MNNESDKEKLNRAEEQIIKLETMLMYQEELLSQLNDLVYQQQQDIDGLKEKVESVMSQLADSIQPVGKEPPPPHYWYIFSKYSNFVKIDANLFHSWFYDIC